MIDISKLLADPKCMPDATNTEATSILRRSRTALLTTFRRDGEPVATPVSITLDAASAHFVTAADSGKARRLARDDRVTLAPCTVSGTPLGPGVGGRARRVVDATRRRRVLLQPTSAVLWSLLLYRLQGKTMHLYEVELDAVGPPNGDTDI